MASNSKLCSSNDDDELISSVDEGIISPLLFENISKPNLMMTMSDEKVKGYDPRRRLNVDEPKPC
jgi:hypothetical protein